MSWVDDWIRPAGLACFASMLNASPVMAEPAGSGWPEYVLRVQQNLKPPPVERIAQKSFSLSQPDVIGDELRREIEDRASAKRFALEGDLLAVTLTAHAGKSAELASLVTQLGGDVEATVDADVFARILPATLIELARRTDLLKLAVPQGDVTGQRVVTSGATPGGQMRTIIAGLHSSGVGGRGITLAVIDESPSASEFEAGSHGASCSALARSVAPDAAVVEIGVSHLSEGRLLRAMQQARHRGAQIVSLSAAGYDLPLDGTASLDRAMQQDGPGVAPLWVVAAGNQARLHWHGSLRDRNENGWIDVRSADAPADQLLIHVRRPGRIRVTVNWNDWAAFRARRQFSDVDAFLYRVSEHAAPELVAHSDLDQDAGARPLERIEQHMEAGFYLLGLRATRLAGDVAIHVFVEGEAQLHPAHAERSLGAPGTAAVALTVGALADGGTAYADYSGRGPTDDGRRKPDAATLLPGGTPFAGTSAATPFIAGLAVLVAQRNPALKGVALKQKVMQFIRPVSDSTDTLALDSEVLRTDLLKAQ